MQEIKTECITVGQAIKIEDNALKIKGFIKKNKAGIIIGSIAIALFSTYTVLILHFINLIKCIY